MENDAPICEECWVRNGAEAAHIAASIWDAANWLGDSEISAGEKLVQEND